MSLSGIRTTGAQRRLLMLAFHFPPDNTSTGVLRTLKFADYLREHGWLSDVISVPTRLYSSTDPGLVYQIPPDTRVFRTPAADAKRLFGVRGVYPAFLGVPDRYWTWIPGVVRLAGKLIRRGEVDALYSTYPVPSALLAGLVLKRRYGLPWVVDFRDPWVEDSMPPLRRRFEGLLERRILVAADRVVCNTPRMREWFLHRYPALSPERLVTITNGYDEEDMSGTAPAPGGRFEILYPGMISVGNRNPEPLLAGVRLALDENRLRADDLRLTFLGAGTYAADERFQNQLDHYGLRRITEVVPARIPYREALNRMAGAGVLVVLSEPVGESERSRAERRWSELQVPAKVYEYLRIGRPLLALVSGGAVADLLAETGLGRSVSPADVRGVARALGDLYVRRAAVGRAGAPIPPEIARYSRRHLSEILARELDALVGEVERRTSDAAPESQ